MAVSWFQSGGGMRGDLNPFENEYKSELVIMAVVSKNENDLV